MQVPVLSADYDVCDMRAVSHTTVLFPKIQDYKCHLNAETRKSKPENYKADKRSNYFELSQVCTM